MAWKNISKRRQRVKLMLESGFQNKEIKKQCSVVFNCSKSAIDTDIRIFMGTTTSQIKRERIGTMDQYICQYCGVYEPNGILEHVVSRSMGGHDKVYNIVWACWSCNSLKKMTVWKPANLDKITKEHPEWHNKVISMAVK